MTVLQRCACATHVVLGLAVLFVTHDVLLVSGRSLDAVAMPRTKTIVLDFDQTLAVKDVTKEEIPFRPKPDQGISEQLQYKWFMDPENADRRGYFRSGPEERPLNPVEIAEVWLGGEKRVADLHKVFKHAQAEGCTLAVVSRGMRMVSRWWRDSACHSY